MSSLVTIEPGAHVKDSVVAIGGKLEVAKTARVGGRQISIDKKLKVVSEDGDKVDLSLNINGHSLVQSVLAEVLDKVHGCKVTTDEE
jgi:hypothetical protein